MNAVGPIWSNRCFRLGVTSLFWLSTAYFIPPFFSTRAQGRQDAPGTRGCFAKPPLDGR